MEKERCHHCMSLVESYPCNKCEYEPQEEQATFALKPGTSLSNGAYTVGLPLGQGGFGITYIAWDNKLDIKLAIKEFYPQSSAGRTSDGNTVAPFSGEKGDDFAYGLEKFLEEAKTVAKFHGHSCIVNVFNFFEENGTGYMVMPYVEGVDLKTYLKQQPDSRISWEKTLKILMPVMDALREIHSKGLLHRDISPDNIYITTVGQVKLLDFGAARYAISEHSHSITSMVKEGYSPEEQYRKKGKFGPFSDIYSLGATMYRCLSGEVPISAMDRAMGEEFLWPSEMGVSIDRNSEKALQRAMAVKGAERFDDVIQLQQALNSFSVKKEEHFADLDSMHEENHNDSLNKKKCRLKNQVYTEANEEAPSSFWEVLLRIVMEWKWYFAAWFAIPAIIYLLAYVTTGGN